MNKRKKETSLEKFLEDLHSGNPINESDPVFKEDDEDEEDKPSDAKLIMAGFQEVFSFVVMLGIALLVTSFHLYHYLKNIF